MASKPMLDKTKLALLSLRTAKSLLKMAVGQQKKFEIKDKKFIVIRTK